MRPPGTLVSSDGYARGEAIDAISCRRGDCDVCLTGSAVRQDGRSASLTAPNGSAQRALLLAAFLHDPAAATISALEAHGTGTALGDPTEARAAVEAIVKSSRVRSESGAGASPHPVAICATKANTGHMEPAAGMAGLHAIAATLQRCTVAPNAWLRRLNRLVADGLGPAECQTALSADAEADERS